MLQSLEIRNLTVFSEASFSFSPQLNVVIGENGTGKTHLLKAAYSVLAATAEEGRKPNALPPTKALLQTRMAEKLLAVFRPDSLGRLVRRKQGRDRCDLRFTFDEPELNIDFSFAPSSKSEVTIEKAPERWMKGSPVYMPTRELMTIYPGFVPTYERHYLEFEETWRDTCLLLGAPLLRNLKDKKIRKLLSPLEKAMGGEIELDKSGRFYLRMPGQDRLEMPLVAEGPRKLAMLARIIATGALSDQAVLFWDEPEANLNPILITQVASTILDLCMQDIQIFIATHSLFLMREIDILLRDPRFKKTATRFFGLQLSDNGVIVEQGETVDDIGSIAALDEDLRQSDRFLDAE